MAVDYKRLKLAEKLANGQLTLTEYQSQFLEYASQANTQRQLRQNQAQVAHAAQQQADAAACMAARQKTANDNAEANAQAANGNYSPAARLAAAMASIADAMEERRACNQQ